jgi:hypothetical protein
MVYRSSPTHSQSKRHAEVWRKKEAHPSTTDAPNPPTQMRSLNLRRSTVSHNNLPRFKASEYRRSHRTFYVDLRFFLGDRGNQGNGNPRNAVPQVGLSRLAAIVLSLCGVKSLRKREMHPIRQKPAHSKIHSLCPNLAAPSLSSKILDLIGEIHYKRNSG